MEKGIDKGTMGIFNEKDAYCQMTILFPAKMAELNRFTHQYNRPEEEIPKISNRVVNILFCVMVCLIVSFMCFSMWLSVEVGINKMNIWTSGKIKN